MPNHKKISPKGAYNQQFLRTTAKTGKWRGRQANLYKRYKSAKRAFQATVIVNGVIKVIGNLKPYVKDWGKLIYQSKERKD